MRIEQFETKSETGATKDVSPPVDPNRINSKTPKRLKTYWVVTIAAIAVVITTGLLLVWWRFSGSSRVGQPVPAPRTVTVEQTSNATTPSLLTITPEAAASVGIKIEEVRNESRVLSGAATSTGVVNANTYRQSPVLSLVTGVVREVNVELGQHVAKEQPLALIFSDELGATQTRYLAALAMLDEHHKHHRRTTSLVEVGGASREELEQATTKLRSSELEVVSLRQRLMLLGLSAQRINALSPSLPVRSDVSLLAPLSGVVVSRSINPGEIVQANTEVLRIADLSSVWVVAQVYEKDMASIRVGGQARIKASAYPDRVFPGKITYVDPNLDTTTRTAQIRIETANPGQKLKLGMYVDVEFVGTRTAATTGPVVPANAVQTINNQRIVFVPGDGAGIFLLRPVRVGDESNGRILVLEGLSAGERVVTEGSFFLRAEWLKLHPGS